MPATRSALQVLPNVTPMIDVMLVLLIVFMVMTPLLATGSHEMQPDGVHLSARPERREDLTLGIDVAGNYYLNGRPVRPAALEAELRALLPARGDDRALYVRADRKLRYAVVRNAMDLAARSGARVVGLIAVEAPRRSR